MGLSSLLGHRPGRSRFSKALPTPPPPPPPPPPGLDDKSQTAPRKLPAAPPAPPPPKKNSIFLTTRPSTTSMRSKNLDSPLPVLPIMAEAPRPRAQAGPITRKPVALLPTQPATLGANSSSKAMKRKSSISSLLSAYSRSSSDWAQMSSHESDYTKDSEPAYSPEQEGMNSLLPALSKNSIETTNNTYGDGMSEVTSYTIIDSFPPPPPPPLKDPSQTRPHTPSTVRPADDVQDVEGEPASLSPMSLRKSGSPRTGREIWRRRASSKSDAGLLIADLKLLGSNGSTASTPVGKAAPPSLLQPPPAKSDHQPTLPLLPKQQQSTTTLPPRTTSLSVSLPGRNIRPIKKTAPGDEGDKMKKFLKISKIKELVRSRGSDDDSDGEQESLQKKSEQRELQDEQTPPGEGGNTEANKPELPAQDDLLHDKQPQQYAANAPRTAAGEASASLASPSAMPGLPPSESEKATSTTISRRPVGQAPAHNPNQPGTQPGLEKKSSFPSATRTLQPSNPVGTLPHPRQRQPPPPRASPAYPYPRSGPTSPTGGAPRSASTSNRPHLPPGASPAYPYPRSGPTSPTGGPGSASTSNRPPLPAGPAAPMPGFYRGRGGPARGNLHHHHHHHHHARAPKPMSPGSRETSPPGFVGQRRQRPAMGPHSPPFLPAPGPSTFINERQGPDVELPMGPAAAAAAARFPRTQDWTTECTTDGVWAANALTEQHLKCFASHGHLTISRNTNYPLACQACGVADKERRLRCIFCELRICQPCTDLLIANGRDLTVVMGILRQQGRIRDWSQYPKRGANQNS
ncbi:hypothetical protein F5Y14DRAFT_212322 [Nemania sp. NC0429]|nr:hypothetical protein F5Y14DRAFT_212322 [Nemania sp. NC0429]